MTLNYALLFYPNGIAIFAINKCVFRVFVCFSYLKIFRCPTFYFVVSFRISMEERTLRWMLAKSQRNRRLEWVVVFFGKNRTKELHSILNPLCSLLKRANNGILFKFSLYTVIGLRVENQNWKCLWNMLWVAFIAPSNTVTGALQIDVTLVGDSFYVRNSVRWALDTLEGLGWRMVGVSGPIGICYFFALTRSQN